MDNDLISRSAHIDKFSAEAKRIAKNDKDFAQALMYVVTCLDCAPAVDAVEVVRCGECKHVENSPYGRYCTVWHGHNRMGDEGFCNYGERKEND